jgi:hypothetical protein
MDYAPPWRRYIIDRKQLIRSSNGAYFHPSNK